MDENEGVGGLGIFVGGRGWNRCLRSEWRRAAQRREVRKQTRRWVSV